MPNATVRLLNRWKAAQGIDSDYRAAQVLGVARQTINNWHPPRNSAAGVRVVVRMCRDLGDDVAACLLAIADDAGPLPLITKKKRSAGGRSPANGTPRREPEARSRSRLR